MAVAVPLGLINTSGNRNGILCAIVHGPVWWPKFSMRPHLLQVSRGKNLKMVLCPSFSFLTAPVFCFFFTTTTMAEPVEKVDIEALARTSASAISYGITQQGFAVLGQTNSFLVFVHVLVYF